MSSAVDADGSSSPGTSGSSSSSRGCSSPQGFDAAAWAQSVASCSPGEAISALPVLNPDWVIYTDHCVASSSTSRVVRGTVGNEAAAIKLYSLRSLASVRRFLHEAVRYVELRALHDQCVVALLALGRLPHMLVPVLALRWAEPIPAPLPESVWRTAKLALQQLHAAGWTHGDIRRQNLLQQGDAVLLCDLETCERATCAQQHEDAARLQRLMDVPEA